MAAFAVNQDSGLKVGLVFPDNKLWTLEFVEAENNFDILTKLGHGYDVKDAMWRDPSTGDICTLDSHVALGKPLYFCIKRCIVG